MKATTNPEWEHVYCAAILAANTSMRGVEIKHLRRRDIDVEKGVLYIRKSKNETRHRILPLNAPAKTAIERMVARADSLGHTEPDHYLWPASPWHRFDPHNPPASGTPLGVPFVTLPVFLAFDFMICGTR